MTDDEVTNGHDVPGFYLCDRPACGARYENLDVAARRAMFRRRK